MYLMNQQSDKGVTDGAPLHEFCWVYPAPFNHYRNRGKWKDGVLFHYSYFLVQHEQNRCVFSNKRKLFWCDKGRFFSFGKATFDPRLLLLRVWPQVAAGTKHSVALTNKGQAQLFLGEKRRFSMLV